MKHQTPKAAIAPAPAGSKYQTEDGRLLHPLTDEQIRALNSHHALLDAFKMALVQIKQDNDERGAQYRATEDQVRAALSLSLALKI